MSNLVSCCNTCPTETTVNVPGIEGPAGTDGADGAAGINAFTLTTADFVVPAISASVTVTVADSTWMTTGQNVFVEGAGTFQVSAHSTGTTATLNYLDYSGNTHAGDTISTGAQISPGGFQQDSTMLPTISSYGTGGSQALTETPAQSLSVSVTLTAAQHYMLTGNARLDLNVCTFSANQIITLTWRRTNNTPGNLTNGSRTWDTGVPVAETSTLGVIPMPPLDYSAGAGDIIQLYASVNGLPYSGAVNIVAAEILAVPLF